MNYLLQSLKNKLYSITKWKSLPPLCVGCIYYVFKDSRRDQTLALVDSIDDENLFCVLLMPSMEAIYLSKQQLQKYIENDTIDLIEQLPEDIVEGLKQEFIYQINTNHQYDLTKDAYIVAQQRKT